MKTSYSVTVSVDPPAAPRAIRFRVPGRSGATTQSAASALGGGTYVELQRRLGARASNIAFGDFAYEWLERHRRSVRPSTLDAIEARLRVRLLPFFAAHRLTEIDAREIDRFQLQQIRQRERIESKHAIGQRAGERPVSNATINRLVGLLAQILDDAVDYGFLTTNPARAKRRRLRARRPARTYLESAEQIVALLDAASDLDERAGPGQRHIGRRAIVSVLVFSGLRIGELLELRWRDVDLAHGWIHVGQAKTDAGIRQVRIRPALARDLASHRERARAAVPADLVFATATGRRHSPSNIRLRVIDRARTLATDRLLAAGGVGLPHLTPHSLRRTFASLLYALGEPPTVVMAELGHVSPGLALAVYARAMSRNDDETERLRAVVA